MTEGTVKGQRRTILAFGIPILMLLATVMLCPYRIWFVGFGPRNWMQTNGLFLFALPFLLSICTGIAAVLELFGTFSGPKILNKALIASQVCATLYVWPLLFSLETLAKQQGDRLLLSAVARADLGLLRIFATETPPYGWTMAALVTLIGTVATGLLVLSLRGKWKEGIGWPLIALAVGFVLAIES